MNAQAVTPPVGAPGTPHLLRTPRAPRARAPVLLPMDALDHTHQQMLLQLSDLSQLVGQLAAQGPTPAARRSAKRICQFFDDNARQHHANEEALVFPALVRKGDKALIQHVLRLQQDHGWLEEDWLELSLQLHAVAQGYSWYDIDALRHAVGVFATLYQDHIALEESLVYPAARNRLAAEQNSRDQRLAANARTAE